MAFIIYHKPVNGRISAVLSRDKAETLQRLQYDYKNQPQAIQKRLDNIRQLSLGTQKYQGWKQPMHDSRNLTEAEVMEQRYR